jgi:cytochrome c556
MALNGGKTLDNPNGLVPEHEHPAGGAPPPGPGDVSRTRQAPAIVMVHSHEGAETGEEHGEEHGGAHTRAQHLVEMSKILQQRARNLQAAAQRKDIVEVSRAAGAVSEECADCHQELRWHTHD